MKAAEQARRTPDGAAGRQGEGGGGRLGRSEIDCLAGVQEVGNRLLLNECVDKVFSNQTGGASLVKKLLLVTSSWLIVDSSNSLMCSWGGFCFARYLTARMSAHLFTETDD